MARDAPRILVLDANVLIDYGRAAREILSLVVEHIGPIQVEYSVFAEVRAYDETWAESLGLLLVDAPIAMTREVARLATARSALSPQDWLCVLLAKHHDGVCVTADRALRNKCTELGVDTWWGLELMLRLIASKALSAERALQVVVAIAADNPRLPKTIVADFAAKLQGER